MSPCKVRHHETQSVRIVTRPLDQAARVVLHERVTRKHSTKVEQDQLRARLDVARRDRMNSIPIEFGWTEHFREVLHVTFDLHFRSVASKATTHRVDADRGLDRYRRFALSLACHSTAIMPHIRRERNTRR